MDITELTDSLRQDLARAAEVGGDDTRAAAEKLLLALEPSLRLTLMDALSQAASDISAQIPGVTVGVRLQGREPAFVVDGAPPQPPPDEPIDENDHSGHARITLRLPESVKARADVVAARRGQSLNTFLVTAARSAIAWGESGHAVTQSLHNFGMPPGKRVKGWAR